MQILNNAPGPRAILSIGLKLRPGEIGTVDDDAWKKAKKRPVVKEWLDRGELKEISATEANKRADTKADGGEKK